MGKKPGKGNAKPNNKPKAMVASKTIAKKNHVKPQKENANKPDPRPQRQQQKPAQNKNVQPENKLEAKKQPQLQNEKKQKVQKPQVNGNVAKPQPKKVPNVKKDNKTKPEAAAKKNKPEPKQKPKPETKVVKPKKDEDASDKNVAERKIVEKLDKRSKNRAKAEIKKEIILKGKTVAVLAKPEIVRKKLNKLKAKPEPRSVKIQKKILMLENLLNRLSNEGAADQKVVVKVEEEDDVIGKAFPRNEFVVFVGHLKPTVTRLMLKEHFDKCGEIQRIAAPTPKRRKSRRFAYIQFDSEESRQNALKLHESKLGDCILNVLYANKGKSKNIEKKNKILQTQRRNKLGDKKVQKIAMKLKTEMKKENKVNKMKKSASSPKNVNNTKKAKKNIKPKTKQ